MKKYISKCGQYILGRRDSFKTHFSAFKIASRPLQLSTDLLYIISLLLLCVHMLNIGQGKNIISSFLLNKKKNVETYTSHVNFFSFSFRLLHNSILDWYSSKDGYKGNNSLISWMLARPSWVIFVCKKWQYQGEIALVTNLRPLMSEQLLKFGYILYYLNGEYIS